MNSISIEMCSRKDKDGNYYIADNVIGKTAELTRHLMKRYGISEDCVLRHYDVWDKKCSEPFVRNPKLWNDFKNLLKGDDEIMSKEYEELKAEIDALKKTQRIYHYWAELPDWALPTVRKLYNRGIFKGESKADLNLPEVLMRTMVINDRAGLYD